MKLTETAIRNAKPKEKDYKLFDGNGLFLRVDTKGGRYRRFKYRFDNREMDGHSLANQNACYSF